MGSAFIEAGEVILSAGAIHSPAILLRSGVGPADRLRALWIQVVADRPGVGKNLHDHPTVVLPIELRPEQRPVSPRIPIAGCFLRWPADAPNDVGICALDILGVDRTGGGLMVALLRPYSRGQLMIRSPDPHSQPLVEFRMLTDERDRTRLWETVRHAIRMLQQKEFRELGTANLAPLALSEEEVDRWLASACEAFSHAAGSCRMGDKSDPLSVVDPDGSVIGVEGVRVIDASVMPSLPRGAPHLTVVMIAEHRAGRPGPY